MEYLYTDSDGITTKFTEDMVKAALDEREQLRNQLKAAHETGMARYERTVNLRTEVYEFFNERYDTNDDEITCSVEDVNQLLESIGADKLKKLFTVSGRIEFTISDIEAESEDDAREIVESNLSADFDGNTVDDYSVEINDVDQQ